MAEAIVNIPGAWMVVGIDNTTRKFYRSLRTMGVPRRDANLITVGRVMGNPKYGQVQVSLDSEAAKEAVKEYIRYVEAGKAQ